MSSLVIAMRLGREAGSGKRYSRISSVPDGAVLILVEPMRPGVGRLEGIFRDTTGLRIEPAEHIVHLARVPERSIRRRQRVVRPRPGRGHQLEVELGVLGEGGDVLV